MILAGNAGDQPEYKLLQNSTPVARLSIATTDTCRLKNGELQTQTQWHTLILWRGLATVAHQYIRKGSLLYVAGKLRTRCYEDKAGLKKYVTEVLAHQLILLDKKAMVKEPAIELDAPEPLPF